MAEHFNGYAWGYGLSHPPGWLTAVDATGGQDVPDAFLDALQVYWTLKQAFGLQSFGELKHDSSLT